MPSLRVLPVRIPCGSMPLAEIPEAPGVEWLEPVESAALAEALARVTPHLLLLLTSGGATWPGEWESLESLERIPIVVLAAAGDETAATEAMQRGAQDYLIAGELAPPAFARTLRRAAERHRASQSQAERELVETVERYRFLLDHLPQIVWTADREGEVIYVNRFGIDYAGCGLGEVQGSGWVNLIHPEDVEATLKLRKEGLSQGVPFDLTHRLRAKDGTYRWHELRAAPRCDAQGNIVEWIGTEADIDDQRRVQERLTEAHDELGIRILERTSELAHANELLQAEVAERRRAEAEAQRARETAEAANRSKTEFLANISHEIRTPMNGIIGMTELAMETNLDLQQREYLQLVAHSADSLLVLINDMLDFAKIESGRLELENEPFALRRMLEDSVKAMAVRASQKGLLLELNVDPDVPAGVVGDPVRLRQVIINLLGNSVKFTEKGRIDVRVSRTASWDGRADLLFEVSDTGIGIPEDKQAIIFEAFAQVDGSMTRRYGGTGLGLAIVSSLVRKMGGEIRVSSRLGEGSTFAFNLPVQITESHEEALALAVAPEEPLAPARLRIMVVAPEDSETAASLPEMLREMDREVTVFGQGRAALAEIIQAQTGGQPYRLIMVDTQLDDMTGCALVEMLGKDRALNAPVVLMLPGTATPDEVKNAWAAGPDWVIYKPVMPADLREMLERSQMMVEPEAPPSSGFGGTPAAPAVKSSLRVLIAEDNMVNQVVAERILSSFGCSLVTVSNGREAVAALERERFDLVLMDIQMPEMDGMEATRRIRAFPDERAHLPIVAMTAHAMKGDRERFLAAGMDHYISKPFHKDELLLLIKSIEPRVRRSASADPVHEAHPIDPVAPPESSVSLKRFLRVMGGDEALFRGACDLFAEWTPGLLKDLGMAMEAHEAVDAGRLAHNLKDSLDSVGARETSERVTVMEANLRSRDFPGATALFQGIEEDIRAILAEIQELKGKDQSGTQELRKNE